MAKYWEDFNIGERYYSRGLTVTDSIVSVCSGLLGITEVVVWDEEAAKKTVFGGRVAPGSLMLTLCDALSLINREDAKPLFAPEVSIALVGIEGKFKAPTRIGDTVSAEFEIVEKRETKNPERGLIMYKCTLRNQSNTELIEAKLTNLIKRRK